MYKAELIEAISDECNFTKYYTRFGKSFINLLIEIFLRNKYD